MLGESTFAGSQLLNVSGTSLAGYNRGRVQARATSRGAQGSTSQGLVTTYHIKLKPVQPLPLSVSLRLLSQETKAESSDHPQY